MPENDRRRIFALVYTDESGAERRSWYADKKHAENVGREKKRKYRIEILRL